MINYTYRYTTCFIFLLLVSIYSITTYGQPQKRWNNEKQEACKIMSDLLDDPRLWLMHAMNNNKPTSLKSLTADTELPDSMHAYRLEEIEKIPGFTIGLNQKFYYKYRNNRSALSAVYSNIFPEEIPEKIGTDSMAYDENGLLEYFMKRYSLNFMISTNSKHISKTNPFVFYYEGRNSYENNLLIQQKQFELTPFYYSGLSHSINYDLFFTKRNQYYNPSGNIDSIIYSYTIEKLNPFYTSSFSPLDTMQHYDSIIPQYEKYIYRDNNQLVYQFNKKWEPKYDPYDHDFHYSKTSFGYVFSLQKTESLESENFKKTTLKFIDSSEDKFSGIDNLTDDVIDTIFLWNRIYEISSYYNTSGNLDSAHFNYQVKEPYITPEVNYSINQYKVYYTYNEKGLVSDIFYHEPSSEENVWTPFLKMRYYYTPNGSLLYYDKHFIYDLTGEWKLEESEKYFYPDLPTTIHPETANKSVKNLSVFPNPVNDILYIYYAGPAPFSYQILNIQGQTVLAGTATQPQLNVNTLKKGIYLLKVTSGSQSGVSRFVKP